MLKKNLPLNKVFESNTLRDTLTEFVIIYLFENPDNIIEYGISFFKRLKESREREDEPLSSARSAETVSTGSEKSELPFTSLRRKSVISEIYDPSKDHDDIPINEYSPSKEQQPTLKKTLRSILIFRSLDDEQLDVILSSMFERELNPNEIVFNEGDEGDYLYIVENGLFDCYKGQTNIETYKKGSSFGELALIHQVRRKNTVIAKTNGKLWIIDRRTYNRIVARNYFNKNKLFENILINVPLLRTLNDTERKSLVDAFQIKRYLKGDVIFKEGENVNGVYYIVQGSVLLQSKDNEDAKQIRNLNEYIGLHSLLTSKPSLVEARAKQDLVTAFLCKDGFERLIGPCIDILKRNMNCSSRSFIETFNESHTSK